MPFELPPTVEKPLLLHGNCLDLLRELPDASVHVVIADPPAGIGFMGKEWDSFKNYNPRCDKARSTLDALLLLGLRRWEAGFVAFLVDMWTEVDRVIKPGGFVCAWALPKTADLAGLAMRIVGWRRHDSILHLFGQGWAKAGKLDKKIDAWLGAEREVVGPSANARPNSDRGNGSAHGDYGRTWDETAPGSDEAKRWDGWSTQLAPGFEEWLVARKPKTKGMSDAEQALTHHCGAMNVKACAVPRGADARERIRKATPKGTGMFAGDSTYGDGHRQPYDPTDGEPKNVVITRGGDVCPAEALDRQSGYQRDGTAVRRNGVSGDSAVSFGARAVGSADLGYGGGGGASRYFNVFDDVVRYQAKNRDRSKGLMHGKHRHPTPKPLALIEHLVRLFAATSEQTQGEPAIVLDPVMGTGITGVACVKVGARFIGIEMAPCETDDSPNFEIARSKILAAIGSPEEARRANEAAPEGSQLSLL